MTAEQCIKDVFPGANVVSAGAQSYPIMVKISRSSDNKVVWEGSQKSLFRKYAENRTATIKIIMDNSFFARRFLCNLVLRVFVKWSLIMLPRTVSMKILQVNLKHESGLKTGRPRPMSRQMLLVQMAGEIWMLPGLSTSVSRLTMRHHCRKTC